MRLIVTLLTWLFSFTSLFAQLGTNPSSLKWQQINTEHFKVLFPVGFEREGQRMANTLQYLHGPVSTTLGKAPHKVPVVLQNQGSISNGFVALSPRRSEFYATSPQNANLLGTYNWLNLLAIHEFRHIVQFEQTYDSRTKLAYYLFGQNGLLALGNAAVPDWFWEGDAVATETAFSATGRGRIPDFDLLFRTTLLERGPFSYNKQHLGSFKDNVANHYVTGYHMVTHVRRQHEPAVWGKIMREALNHFYIPFTFSRAMRQYTGKRLIPTYKGMVQELDSLWTAQADSISVTPATVLTKRKRRTYTDYLYPQPLSDGGFVALKSGLADIPTFVRLDADGSNEQELFSPGTLNNGGQLSVVKDKIVWSEFEYDPRWRTRQYSVIKTFDIATKTYQVLKRKTRLAAPVFSPDAQTIAAVEVDTDARHALVLVEASTGKEIKRMASPDNDFISMPRWSADGTGIVVLRTRQNERTISLVNAQTGSFTDLMPYTAENIAHPVIAGEYVYFNAPYNGIENIYAFHLPTKKQYQVASRRYAGINPALSLDGSELLINDFSYQGYNVAKMPNTPTQWKPVEGTPQDRIAYYRPLVEQEANPDILAKVPAKDYPVTRYRRFPQLFNPHSWMPTIDPDNNQVSLSVLSQDVLSNAVTTLGYTRNVSEKSGRTFANISYQGWYPITNINAATGYRVTEENDDLYQWKEKSLGLGFSLPLLLTRSRYNQFLTLTTNARVTSVSEYTRPRKFRYLSEQTNGTLRNVLYSAAYQRTLRRNRRDLAGRFEQRALVYYNHTPVGGNFKSELFAVNTRFAFPGLLKHHSMQFGANYQKQDTRNYVFSSPIVFPRGYKYQTLDEFYGLTAQYQLPLWYPDIALGPFLYFQRLRTNVFYDYGKGSFRNTNPTFQSVGIELTTDFNIMRLNLLFDAGVRISYLPLSKKPHFDLLLADFGL